MLIPNPFASTSSVVRQTNFTPFRADGLTLGVAKSAQFEDLTVTAKGAAM
jgi:hypothetical protein